MHGETIKFVTVLSLITISLWCRGKQCSSL